MTRDDFARLIAATDAKNQAEARSRKLQLRAEVAEREVIRLTAELDQSRREVDILKARILAISGGSR